MLPSILEGWLNGKKRRSRHSNNEVPFATKRERMRFDRQFLKDRERKRKHDGARRAKAVRGPSS